MPRRRAPRSDEERGAWDAALAMLGRRALSAARLRDRIARKFDAAEAERVVARLLVLGLLDDRKYAEAFTRDRFGRAGYGRARIRADLLARGVAAADADAAIAAIVDPEAERERAMRVLARFRRRKEARPEPVAPLDAQHGGGEHDAAGSRAPERARQKLREAAFRHLIGRGFCFDLAREVIDRSL